MHKAPFTLASFRQYSLVTTIGTIQINSLRETWVVTPWNLQPISLQTQQNSQATIHYLPRHSCYHLNITLQECYIGAAETICLS